MISPTVLCAFFMVLVQLFSEVVYAPLLSHVWELLKGGTCPLPILLSPTIPTSCLSLKPLPWTLDAS